MGKFNSYLRKIVRDHHTIMFVGIMFIIMGLINLNDHLLENLVGIKIKIGHGLILMGVFNVLLSITFLINGISTLEASIESDNSAPDPNELLTRIDKLEKEINELKNKGK